MIEDATSDLATTLKWCEANPEKYTPRAALARTVA